LNWILPRWTTVSSAGRAGMIDLFDALDVVTGKQRHTCGLR